MSELGTKQNSRFDKVNQNLHLLKKIIHYINTQNICSKVTYILTFKTTTQFVRILGRSL